MATPDSFLTAGGRERRRTPRIQVMGRLHGRSVALGLPVRIREVGFGGFSLESSVPFPKGAEHLFRFTLDDGTVVEVQATSIHTMQVTTPGGPSHFSGFAFSDPDRSRAAIDRLMDAVTGVIAFD